MPPAPQPQPSKVPDPAAPRRGLVAGRFLPPHAGHQFLVDFARHYVERLTLVLRASSQDPLPAAQRMAWLEELFGAPPLLHFSDRPLAPPEWADWLKAQLGPVDYVFASEPTAARWVESMGAELVLVDPERRTVPVSGSRIRQRPFSCWRYLPPCVRSHYARRVVIAGCEGSGKTTLTQDLAERFRTLWVCEHAATLAQVRVGRLTAGDLLRAARAQRAAEEALARQAERVLFLDTDALMARAWSLRLHGRALPELDELASSAHYDLYLILDPLEDASPDQRAFHDSLIQLLESQAKPVCRLSGNAEERRRRASEAVETLLVEPLLPL